MIPRRHDRGHAVIELAIGGAIGGVLLSAMFAFHVQQRASWRAALHAADDAARTSEALRAMAFAARGATRVRIDDTRSAAGHRIALEYAASPLAGSADERMSGICAAAPAAVEVRADAHVSNVGATVMSQWLIRVQGSAGPIDQARKRAAGDVSPVRSELYCEYGDSGYETPVVTDIAAMFAARRPAGEAVATVGMALPNVVSLDVCVVTRQDRDVSNGGAGCSNVDTGKSIQDDEAFALSSGAVITRIALRSRVVPIRGGT